MEINKNEYVILFTPTEDKEDGEFSGHVGIRVLYDSNNDWDERTRYLMLEMLTLVTATVPLLETEDEFLKIVRDKRTQLLEEGSLAPIYDDTGTEIKDTPLITGIKDNVIHVDWKKKNGRD